MNFSDIQNRLLSTDLESGWDATTRGWANTDNNGRKQSILYVREVRDQALSALRPINDPEQTSTALAVQYIEIKSRWIMLNTMINYELATTGAQDGETVLRASLLTSLLVEIEGMLSSDDLNSITAFLARPIGTVAGPATKTPIAA